MQWIWTRMDLGRVLGWERYVAASCLRRIQLQVRVLVRLRRWWRCRISFCLERLPVINNATWTLLFIHDEDFFCKSASAEIKTSQSGHHTVETYLLPPRWCLHFRCSTYRCIFNHFYVISRESYRIRRNYTAVGAITPFKVIQGHQVCGTNRKLICDFLLVINTHLAPTLHRFRDIAFYKSKIAIFGYPLVFNSSDGGVPLGRSP